MPVMLFSGEQCAAALSPTYRANPTIPCQTPLKQRPVRRTEARRSQTKESTRDTTYSNPEAISYTIH